MSLLRYGHQAWLANSICGLTKLLYSITKHSLSISLNCRWIILRTFIDFLAASAHWVDTLRLFVTIIPRSLSSVEADNLFSTNGCQLTSRNVTSLCHDWLSLTVTSVIAYTKYFVIANDIVWWPFYYTVVHLLCHCMRDRWAALLFVT